MRKKRGELADLFTNANLSSEDGASRDVLGEVYEYFLSEFASAEGKRGAVDDGQLPGSVKMSRALPPSSSSSRSSRVFSPMTSTSGPGSEQLAAARAASFRACNFYRSCHAAVLNSDFYHFKQNF